MPRKLTNEMKSTCFKKMNKECGSAKKNKTCASSSLKDCFKKEKNK